MSESDSILVSNGLAVFFSLTIPSLFVVVRRFVLAIKGTDGLQDVGDEDNPFKGSLMLLGGLRNVRDTRDGIWEELVTVCKEDLPSIFHRLKDEPRSRLTIFYVFLYLILAGGTAVSGVFIASNIVTDNMALSNNPKAGLWEANKIISPDKAGMENIDFEKEIRSGQYASTCYAENSNTASISCNLFYNRTVKHIVEEDVACPFDGDVCVRPAIRLSTTQLRTSVLGFNVRSKDQFYFERNMTCAPVDTSESYVRQEGTNDSLPLWTYSYGKTLYQNYTYQNPGDWSFQLAPTPGYDAWSV